MKEGRQVMLFFSFGLRLIGIGIACAFATHVINFLLGTRQLVWYREILGLLAGALAFVIGTVISARSNKKGQS
jgi:MFS family permease